MKNSREGRETTINTYPCSKTVSAEEIFKVLQSCFSGVDLSKGSVPLSGEKKSEKSKIKILFIVWSQCVFQCFYSDMKKYQFSKLNTYLITIFLSEWRHCVYIEIPLRLCPAPTFKDLKNMSAVILHFFIHICEYRMA